MPYLLVNDLHLLLWRDKESEEGSGVGEVGMDDESTLMMMG